MTPAQRHPGDRTMRTAGGRRISWRETGAPDGHPVVALHGLPGSRLKFDVADKPARDLGLRIIAPDRWGYGDTDPHPAPSLEAFVEDTRALADALNIGTFAVMGVSGGGPYAAALATLASDRVIAASLVAPVGPIAGESGIDMDAFHRFCFGPLTRSPGGLAVVFRPFRRMMLATPRAGMAVAMARVPAADRAMLRRDGVRERLSHTFIEGMKRGIEGPRTDMMLFGRPWNLPYEKAAPTSLWLGDQDRSVPLGAARRLAQRLPGCEQRHLEGQGHLWVAANYDIVLGWIAEKTKGAARATP